MKKKIAIIILTIIAIIVFEKVVTMKTKHVVNKTISINKKGYNIFDNTNKYVDEKFNAIATIHMMSTGMYTDANRKDFYIVYKIKRDDINFKEALHKKEPKIEFESYLDRTSEWIRDNKYRVSMYYQLKGQEQRVQFYSRTWVGEDTVVSDKQIIPDKEWENIFIRYESVLNTLLFIKNGNDVRYRNNYLTIN